MGTMLTRHQVTLGFFALMTMPGRPALAEIKVTASRSLII
jgi:hypothetical protein